MSEIISPSAAAQQCKFNYARCGMNTAYSSYMTQNSSPKTKQGYAAPLLMPICGKT